MHEVIMRGSSILDFPYLAGPDLVGLRRNLLFLVFTSKGVSCIAEHRMF